MRSRLISFGAMASMLAVLTASALPQARTTAVPFDVKALLGKPLGSYQKVLGKAPKLPADGGGAKYLYRSAKLKARGVDRLSIEWYGNYDSVERAHDVVDVVTVVMASKRATWQAACKSVGLSPKGIVLSKGGLTGFAIPGVPISTMQPDRQAGQDTVLAHMGTGYTFGWNPSDPYEHGQPTLSIVFCPIP